MPSIRKIVSGGQTGVDRAALDFAIRRGIPHGGYCPKGRRSESGRIAAKYRLTECASADYAMRTALNVAHSDGTLILARGRPEGGTQRTVFLCREYGKPVLVIDLDRKLKSADFAAWLHAHGIEILNVAGPRESKQAGIGRQARRTLEALFAAVDSPALD
jgi:predicted Rossmann fold nucleotide-binding protein DprA/Smf involved in DNA uptake